MTSFARHFQQQRVGKLSLVQGITQEILEK